MSHDCNNFIIRDGVFIRDFEAMYQAHDDPWGQRENEESDISSKASFFLLYQLANRLGVETNYLLNIGCADGYQERILSFMFQDSEITGTDISVTAIKRAVQATNLEHRVQFMVDDIRLLNDSFVDKFDIVFSSKTLYYVAPEIDQALRNISLYLKNKGLFCFVYNQKNDAFTNQWLTYQSLRLKLQGDHAFSEVMFVEFDRFKEETTAIGVYAKNKSLVRT